MLPFDNKENLTICAMFLKCDFGDEQVASYLCQTFALPKCRCGDDEEQPFRKEVPPLTILNDSLVAAQGYRKCGKYKDGGYVAWSLRDVYCHLRVSRQLM